VSSFNSVRTFSATKARERSELGDRITEWLRSNPDCEIADKVVTQSSDNEFHCVTVTLFYQDDKKTAPPAPAEPGHGNGNGGDLNRRRRR